MMHPIVPRMLQQRVTVALVGAGGSGCQMLTGLARMDRALRACGHPGGLAVTTFDPDRVSEANVARQLFSPSDVGQHKATVLTHRVNCFFGLDWCASPRAFDAETAKRQAPAFGIGRDASTNWDLLITCVDSARARREIHGACGGRATASVAAPLYWLDLGNRRQDGQVVLGQMEASALYNGPGQPRLPHVIDLFTELADAAVPEDDAPSCSLAEALTSQDLFINQAVVTWALHLLWRLFRDGGTETHGYFINLASGRVNPIPVPGPEPVDAAKPAARRQSRRVRA